uniref:Rrp44_CSD1 domain-containing protein n=1 Tax=Mesocestoides corti TaxID=53468 RepID=A0A0R3UP51_MESCO
LEVQLKGFLRRRTIGAFYVPIKNVRQEHSTSRHPAWVALGAELKLRNGQIVGTQGQTKNFLFVDIWLTPLAGERISVMILAP